MNTFKALAKAFEIQEEETKDSILKQILEEAEKDVVYLNLTPIRSKKGS